MEDEPNRAKRFTPQILDTKVNATGKAKTVNLYNSRCDYIQKSARRVWKYTKVLATGLAAMLRAKVQLGNRETALRDFYAFKETFVGPIAKPISDGGNGWLPLGA